MLDWTERLTVALTIGFLSSLAVVITLSRPIVWLVWGVAMVLLAGAALIVVNRDSPPG
ncbi:hypothetical protein [Natrarchaeobaculum aegyptiacum]|uniref:hypothetical protein n=1 Tax=Natrarchaeobaculum aegyptiacum TaxID=745377 RepID=UPI001642594D|nr:hypothetical protein [Natrarchaeobaculum aegyptiacum]